MSAQDQPIAIVTGGGRNIGQRTAHVLARDGWRVAVADIDSAAATAVAAEIDPEGVAARGFTCNVMEESSIRELRESITAEMGTVTGIVNNVGITANNALLDTTLEEWNTTMAGCVTCSYLMIREFVPGMIAEGSGGAIVNIASTTGHRGNPGKVAYGVAKAAVLNLTRMAAIEFAGHDIRVNTVTPALTGSPVGFGDEDARSGVPGNIPLARWGTPSDQAEAVAFLLSDRAGFITGTELVVDGGLLARMPK